MATVADIGTPGAPMDSPPLTEWQAAVRDALTPLQGLVVPTAPWAGVGALYCTRAPGIVTIEGALTHTAGLAVAVGTTYTVGTVPAGFRPTVARSAAATVWSGSAYVAPCVADVTPGGALRFIFTTAVTLAANSGAVTYLLTYRGA